MRITGGCQCKDGMRVRWRVKDHNITDAKLSIEGVKIYVCQNVIHGIECKNKHGYKYSYWLDLDYDKVYTIDKPVKTKPVKKSNRMSDNIRRWESLNKKGWK